MAIVSTSIQIILALLAVHVAHNYFYYKFKFDAVAKVNYNTSEYFNVLHNVVQPWEFESAGKAFTKALDELQRIMKDAGSDNDCIDPAWVRIIDQNRKKHLKTMKGLKEFFSTDIEVKEIPFRVDERVGFESEDDRIGQDILLSLKSDADFVYNLIDLVKKHCQIYSR